MVGAVVSFVLLLLSGLHLYWLAGGRVVSAAVVPEVNGRPAFVPGRVATFAVAVALACAAAIVLTRAGLWRASPIPAALAYAGAWVLVVVFLGRAVGDFRLVGFAKRVRGTAFAWWDTFLYSPLCAALGVALLWIATR